MKPVTLQRPDAIEFTLASGILFIVQPVTRAQMRAALALDPEPGEMRAPAALPRQGRRGCTPTTPNWHG